MNHDTNYDDNDNYDYVNNNNHNNDVNDMIMLNFV